MDRVPVLLWPAHYDFIALENSLGVPIKLLGVYFLSDSLFCAALLHVTFLSAFEQVDYVKRQLLVYVLTN